MEFSQIGEWERGFKHRADVTKDGGTQQRRVLAEKFVDVVYSASASKRFWTFRKWYRVPREEGVGRIDIGRTTNGERSRSLEMRSEVLEYVDLLSLSRYKQWLTWTVRGR
jgi:hypothetical protein